MPIPSTSALRALVTLARTGSITGTAEALSVTQSAISHKLKALEEQLGFPLIRREGRGVRLTERARQYVSEIGPALEVLARASETQTLTGSLTLNVASGFAASWLAPRIGSFLAKHPGVALRINTPRGYGDLGARRNDLYISFLLPDEVPAGSTKLMDVGFFPVAAPSMVGGQMVHDATALTRFPLLHLDNRQDWQRWIAAAGSTDTPDAGVVFQDLQIMEMAAKAGQGVSLGDHLTSRAAMERGELMQVHPFELPSPRAYWLVHGNALPSESARAFEAWLLAEL
ncbi:LysR family glycine cleavage system transcriptional activator [Litoreibacter halocynthiae]|uniref:LysR family glycine cleavage system transcriptional activator n=1 Tax=Litoreibacter halocynthiae TaxID=1242689 RepID=A0A4R7LH12_9RHOB|nr:LysR substrate-binding domain-containing protein [Litoreibacter halocynthiae]TDT73932.1 LysR family glycine cleavage system transcriptional activator [Litoreibacter halocynthiae]